VSFSTVQLLRVRHVLLTEIDSWVFVQEDCARTLLFRGADRSNKNRANQTAQELAVNNGNIQLADVIASFSADDVGKYGQNI